MNIHAIFLCCDHVIFFPDEESGKITLEILLDAPLGITASVDIDGLVRLGLRLSVQSVKRSTEPVNQNQINLREMGI